MRPRHALPVVVGALLAAGCTSPEPTVQPASSVTAAHDVQVSETFQRGAGTAITYDEQLVPAGARGAVRSRSGQGTTTVMLAVRGVQPNRTYGAHIHTQPCGELPDDAGPHFQYSPDPVQPSVDPTFANSQNEMWLDIATDETGAGSTETTVTWTFPDDRRPKSVVVHADGTASEPGQAGTAGGRVACISVDF
jgi:superoxide dismutase, Cu-Zn family